MANVLVGSSGHIQSLVDDLIRIMKTQKTVKKRNPQDATLRNIRALKKRVRLLELRLAGVMRRCNVLEGR